MSCGKNLVRFIVSLNLREKNLELSSANSFSFEDLNLVVWLRCKRNLISDAGNILLASAAQDYLIRVWRFSHRQKDTGYRTDSVKDLPTDVDIQITETTLSFHYNGTYCLFDLKSLVTVQNKRTKCYWFNSWLGQYSRPGLIIVSVTGSFFSHSCIVSIMVIREEKIQWLMKNILQSTGKMNLRKAWIAVLAAKIQLR